MWCQGEVATTHVVLLRDSVEDLVLDLWYSLEELTKWKKNPKTSVSESRCTDYPFCDGLQVHRQPALCLSSPSSWRIQRMMTKLHDRMWWSIIFSVKVFTQCTLSNEAYCLNLEMRGWREGRRTWEYMFCRRNLIFYKSKTEMMNTLSRLTKPHLWTWP